DPHHIIDGPGWAAREINPECTSRLTYSDSEYGSLLLCASLWVSCRTIVSKNPGRPRVVGGGRPRRVNTPAALCRRDLLRRAYRRRRVAMLHDGDHRGRCGCSGSEHPRLLFRRGTGHTLADRRPATWSHLRVVDPERPLARD